MKIILNINFYSHALLLLYSNTVPKKEVAIKHVTLLAAYILIVWGFYRFLFKLPEELEEILVKPVVWLVPVAYFLKKENKGLASIGITSKNLFPAVYFALGLGAVFAIEGVFVNFIKHEGFNFSANIGERVLFFSLGLSLITAITEEITFRGYMFSRVLHGLGNEWGANALTSVFWGLVHMPVGIFWLQLSPMGILGFFLLTTVFGVGSAFVYARTKNIFSSILLHFLWAWPIILFR